MRIFRSSSFTITSCETSTASAPRRPIPNLKPDYSERFHLAGYNRIQQEEAYKFYQQWTSPNFPRVLIVKIQHANPYYDDSYAVNSANLGPYGDAIENELIPAIEKQFRGLGQGWARFVYGGSTGGWESLAVQVFYPDHYNGAFAACPDPVDFHALHDDQSLRRQERLLPRGRAQARSAARHARLPGPHADHDARRTTSTNSRSAITAAAASSSTSGRPSTRRSATTAIPSRSSTRRPATSTTSVADYWREHYDLEAILERDWATLGPKLAGKIHIYVGSDDTYFLNDAVYRMEDFLKSTKNPAYGGEVTYGRAPSIAGTAIRRCRTRTRACTTTRSTCRRSWSGSRRQHQPAPI